MPRRLALDSQVQEDLDSLKKHGLYRSLNTVQGACEPEIVLNGRKFLQFSSNNYLGLATHPRVKWAAIQAIQTHGIGSGASRLISGTSDLHARLELALADFKQTEAALVYATGSMANLGVLPCLVGSGDLVLLDELDHATLYDGARLSRAEVQTFKHNDLGDLEIKLKAGKGRKTLIAVDGLFSMDGDIAPLPGLSTLARKYGVLLLVDEAHATGVLGRTGRGTLEHFGLPADAVDVQIGTLSKALGSLGGFAACSQALREWLINKSRSFLFATALPPACAAAALEALAVIREESSLRQALWYNTRWLLDALDKCGVNTLKSETPVIPVVLGKPDKALEVQKRLWDEGIYVPAIRPPTVPRHLSRLRISLMATHTDDQVRLLSSVLAEVL
jgi:8-amino-7-oxononanoate synthase